MSRSLHFALSSALRRATEDWFAIPGPKRGHQLQREFPRSKNIPRTENGKLSSSTSKQKRLNSSGNTEVNKNGESESSQRGSQQQTSQQATSENSSYMSLRQHQEILQQMQRKSNEIAPQSASENKAFAVSKNSDIFSFNFTRPNPKNQKDGINSLINESTSGKDVPTIVGAIDEKQLHSDTVGYFSGVKGNDSHSIHSIFAIKDEDIHLDIQQSGSKGSQQFDGAGIEMFQDGVEENTNSKKTSLRKENHETMSNVQESVTSHSDRGSDGEKREKSKFTYPNPPKEMTLDEFDSNNDRSPLKSEIHEEVANGVVNHANSEGETQISDNLNNFEGSKKNLNGKTPFKTINDIKENKVMDEGQNRSRPSKAETNSCLNSSGVEKKHFQATQKSKRKNSHPSDESERKKRTKIEPEKEEKSSPKAEGKMASGSLKEKEVVGIEEEEDNYGLELDEDAPSL